MKGSADMKRFHIHVGVENLDKSVAFYSAVFGQQPSKLKPDYAKWMLEDPRVNFAISTRANTKGVDHLGLQVDEDAELTELTDRLKKADLGVFGEGEATCCYAESKKAWVVDPSGVPWEAYRTMADAEVYKEAPKASASECCAPAAMPGNAKVKSKCC